MPFVKGQRPTAKSPPEPKTWAQHLADSEDAIFRKVVQLAKKGEPGALRLAMNQLTPRMRVVRFALPEINNVDDIVPALSAISRAAANGQLSPDEAASFAELVAAYRSAFELGDLAKRLAELEEFVRNRLSND